MFVLILFLFAHVLLTFHSYEFIGTAMIFTIRNRTGNWYNLLIVSYSLYEPYCNLICTVVRMCMYGIIHSVILNIYD
jgi:hypothetical protein